MSRGRGKRYCRSGGGIGRKLPGIHKQPKNKSVRRAMVCARFVERAPQYCCATRRLYEKDPDVGYGGL